MKVAKILSYISPSNIRIRNNQRILAKVQKSEAELDRLTLENHPDLVHKRFEVRKFMAEGAPYQPKEGEFLLNFGQLMTTNIEDLLKSCGDDLGKIRYLFGDYGLAKYVDIQPDRILLNKNPNIFESGYQSGQTAAYSFDNYMLSNSIGSLQELFSRFGKCGEIMYDSASRLGFVKTGTEGYKLNNFGLKNFRTEIAMTNLADAMDIVIKL